MADIPKIFCVEFTLRFNNGSSIQHRDIIMNDAEVMFNVFDSYKIRITKTVGVYVASGNVTTYWGRLHNNVLSSGPEDPNDILDSFSKRAITI